MRIRTYRLTGLTLALIVGASALTIDERKGLAASTLRMSAAEAIIGRPATPVSYAGVARRTTRRAVGAAAAAPVVVAPTPGCVQVVNSYGQVYWQCP